MSSVSFLLLASAAGALVVLVVVAFAARAMCGSAVLPLVYFGLAEERLEPTADPRPPVEPAVKPMAEAPARFDDAVPEPPKPRLVDVEERLRQTQRKLDEIEERYSLRAS